MYIHNAVVIVVDDFGVNLTGNSYFTHVGNALDAQTYYDNLCLGLDTLPISRIVSVKDSYMSVKAFYFQNFWFFLSVFLMVLLAIGVNIYHIAVLNCEIHVKKFAILKSEGRNTFALIWNELKICIILLLIAEVILLRFMNIITSLIWIIGIYFMLDLLLLWCVTGYRMRNFAERLR